MAIPTTALTGRHDEIRQMIMTRLQFGKVFWRPLHMRQDYWSMMYKLEDVMQMVKPAKYRKFISNEPHCVTPETLVLTADLQWIPAGELRVGQQLFAFEDVPSAKLGKNPRGLRARHQRRAMVTAAYQKTSTVYKITLADGRIVRATGEHKWLARKANIKGFIDWVSTEDMAVHFARRDTAYPGKHGANAGRMWLPQFFAAWDAGVDDRDAGYLAGAFDADGTVYRKVLSNHFPEVEFTQYENACLSEVKAALTRKGFSFTERVEKTPKGNQPIHRLYLNGGRSELMRFLGQIRPPRLLARFAAMYQDDVELRAIDDVEIVSVEPDGDKTIVALTSSSGTYITEYGASHNTAVDLALSILTRNDAFWRIALFETADENQDERRFIGKIERALQGMIYDVDEMFSMRLKQRFWKQAAAQALLRGYIWGKVQITQDALKYRDTPIVAEMYDPRMVYPHIDAWGLSYVLIETLTTLGDLVNSYPDTFQYRESEKDYDPNRPATKIEYWSNDRGSKKGICAVMAQESVSGDLLIYDSMNVGAGMNTAQSPAFVIPPYFHGYSPTSLPVVGVAVNGLNLLAQPAQNQLVTEQLTRRTELLGQAAVGSWWTGQNAHIADSGRSILAAVEEHVPQYNELIATIMQHFAISAYGTWVFTSPTGEQPRFQPGIEAKIALTPDEKLDRIQVGPINADAYKLVELLGDEKQNGMLANILRANQPGGMNGVLFQQMANAALNALEPFQDGMEELGTRIGGSILEQLKMAGPILKPFEVLGPKSATSTKRQAYWVVEFDPKELKNQKRRLRPRPVFKPALPDDLAVRINAARLALDPRRPILSLTTVLEHILQVEDPTDEIDRIWEDIANTDPVLVFEQIAAALKRMGEDDLAERITEKQFRTAFMEELQFRQASGTDIPAPGQMPPGGGDMSNMPPEAGGGQFNTQTEEGMGGGGMGGAAGGGGAGAMGERATV